MSLDDIKEGLDDAEQKAEWLRKRIEVTGPEYDEDRDGQLFPVVLTTPAQAFYNRAIFPGWQKWNPIFRHGTITAINDGLADITLESVQSSAQDMEINQESTLSGVPFEYMSCDHLAFSVGDVVLIMFSDQMFSDPKVIGFKEEPRGCGPWPAIEVFDGTGSSAEFLGVVLCLGGGFDPPYEFIPKDDPLPEDESYGSAGPLPFERIWDGWEDIEPLGIAMPSFSVTVEPTVDHNKTVTPLGPRIYRGRYPASWAREVHTKTTSVCGGSPYPLPYIVFRAEGNWYYSTSRTENYTLTYGFNYFLGDDPSPGYWEYEYEGDEKTVQKPGRILNIDVEGFRITSGGGTASFFESLFTDVSRSMNNLKFNPTGSIGGITFGCYTCPGEDKSEEVEGKVISYLNDRGSSPEYFSYDEEREYMYRGTHYYSYTVESEISEWPWGSVKSPDEFAMVYDIFHESTLYTKVTGEVLNESEIASEAKTLCVSVDGEVFELFTAGPGARLQFGYGTKYFQFEDKSIGLFFFDRNESAPYSYQYAYAEVDRVTGDKKAVVTPMDSDEGELPGVTGLDGNPVYHKGYGRFRLISKEGL